MNVNLLDNLLLIILSLEQDCLFVSATRCLSLIRTYDICGRYSGCVSSYENGHCSMMLSTFPPLCLSPIDHTDFFLCPAGVCFKVVWFAQIPIGCRWPQLGGADYNQVLSNCWSPHEQGWALTGSTGATGGQEPPGGGGTHISLRTFPQRVATY